jgi:8-oxo-dGTP pyrophosphatase MutT (NUDIX family)
VIDRIHGLLLQVFRRLPARARRAVVHGIAPSYYVGAIALVQRDDGSRLFVRHTYRRRWGVPGGLVGRGEDPRDAVRREAREEVGLRIELVGEPAVVVDPETRRVDIIFAARPAADADADAVAPHSPEIAECRWFGADDLPPLQHETAGALVTLARRQTSIEPGGPPPDPVLRRPTG